MVCLLFRSRAVSPASKHPIEDPHMASHPRQLLAQFDKAMLNIYEAARKLKPPYTPTEFRRMVAELGGKETADRLLAARTPSSGFAELFLRGKENLKLSVEYLVLT